MVNTLIIPPNVLGYNLIMKKLLLIIVVLAALFVVFGNKPFGENSPRVFSSTIMPLSFEIPEGYIIKERIDTIIIMREEDYQSLQSGEREGGEGPPTITIRVIDNPNNPSALDWVEQYPPQSNYNLKTSEVTERTISGYKAISYEADGLYPNRNVIIETDYRLYYINGQYLDKNSELYRDFEPLVNSIEIK